MTENLSGLPDVQTSRLRLSPLRVEDAGALQAFSDRSEILDWIHFLPNPFGVADAEALIRAKGDGRDRFVGLGLREEETLIGVLGVHLQGEARLEIGYWLDPARHGQGYVTEAGRGVLAFVTGLFPHRQVVAHALPTNQRSLRVLEKLGFRPADEAASRPDRNLFILAR